MSAAKEIANNLENSFRENRFNSEDSIVRIDERGNYMFGWKSGNVSVKGELSQQDSIGLMLSSLVIEKDIEEEEVEVYLKSVAEAIEARVKYLLEPLKIVERDGIMKAVQIRSDKPEINEGSINYYEIILKSGAWFGHRNRLTLTRYSQPPDSGNKRRIIAFPITKAQFERLLNDFLEIL